MNRRLAKAVLFGLPAIVFLACSSSDGEESGGKKGADKSAKGDVGNWDIVGEPNFGKEFGMFKNVKLTVKNVSDSDDEPWLEIRLTNKGGDLVTTFDCIGDTVEPGQKTTLDCSSLDDYAPFSDYEIKNAF